MPTLIAGRTPDKNKLLEEDLAVRDEITRWDVCITSPALV